MVDVTVQIKGFSVEPWIVKRRVRHWTAVAAHRLVTFLRRNWKWVMTYILAVLAVLLGVG